MIGSLDKCLNHNTLDNFMVCEDNIEGYVLKPYTTNLLDEHGNRLTLKRKTRQFVETKNKVKHELTDEQKDLFNQLCCYVTEPRIMNVISHHGVVGQKDFNKLLKMVHDDIVEDFILENNSDPFEGESKLLQKSLKGRIAEMLRPVFMREINFDS